MQFAALVAKYCLSYVFSIPIAIFCTSRSISQSVSQSVSQTIGQSVRQSTPNKAKLSYKSYTLINLLFVLGKLFCWGKDHY